MAESIYFYPLSAKIKTNEPINSQKSRGQKTRILLAIPQVSVHCGLYSVAGVENLQDKLGTFREITGTKKALLLTMVTTYGVENNTYWGLAQNDLTMGVLFE